MNETSLRSGEWLPHIVVGGGLLLLLVHLLMRRTRQPARSQYLGEWGMAAALLLAGLSLGPSWLRVPLLRPQSPSGVERQPILHRDALASLRYPLAEEHAACLIRADEEQDAVLDERNEPQSAHWLEVSSSGDGAVRALALPIAEPSLGAIGEVPSRSLLLTSAARWVEDAKDFLPWLGLAYAVVAVVLLGRWLVGYLALWHLLRTAGPAPGTALRLFRRMTGRPHRPRLLVSAQIRAPLSCGLFRPTVVIPPALCQPGREGTLRWVFAHELTHLQRHDAWSCLLFGLGQAVYFYLPWFWWLRRQVRLCQEYIADAAAVQEADYPEDYAEFLLSLTSAPAVPLSATGVLGNSSDLFRRVTMLLQNSAHVERGCPRWWSLATAGVLLALAVVVSGLGLRAQAAPRSDADLFLTMADEQSETPQGQRENPPAKEPTKRETRSRERSRDMLPDIEQLLQNLPDSADPEKVKQLRDELMKAREQMKRAMDELEKIRPQLEETRRRTADAVREATRLGLQGLNVARLAALDGAGEGRLGVSVEKPSAVLADQLDLPRNQGLIITEVQPDSAAAKAGLKANDILLELNGKPISGDATELQRMLAEIKPDTTVNAVVLRKGRKETIRGITLKEGRSHRIRVDVPLDVQALPRTAREARVEFGLPREAQAIATTGRGIMTTTFRTDDHFTTRHQEGSLIITVTGKVAGGKAKTNEIQVQDGRVSHKYESLDKVPEQYRDKVKNLIEMNEKTGTRIEIKSSYEERRPVNIRKRDARPADSKQEIKKLELDGIQLDFDPLEVIELEVLPEGLNKLEELKLFERKKPDPKK